MASDTTASMGAEISSFDELFATESLGETLDFDFIIDGINSLPLYERLGIQEDMLTADELAQMKTHASLFAYKFNKKLTNRQHAGHRELRNIMPSEKNNEPSREGDTFDTKELNNPLNSIDEDIETPDRFLSYMYNTTEEDSLIKTFKKNLNFNIVPESKKVYPPDKLDMSIMQKYLTDVKFGKFDDLAFKNPSPLPSSSSSSESEEELSVKAREYSSSFRATIDQYKYNFLKNIVDDSIKVMDNVPRKDKINLKSAKWISSDDDSETEIIKRQNELDAKRRKRRVGKNKDKAASQSKIKNTKSSSWDKSPGSSLEPNSNDGVSRHVCENQNVSTPDSKHIQKMRDEQKPDVSSKKGNSNSKKTVKMKSGPKELQNNNCNTSVPNSKHNTQACEVQKSDFNQESSNSKKPSVSESKGLESNNLNASSANSKQNTKMCEEKKANTQSKKENSNSKKPVVSMAKGLESSNLNVSAASSKQNTKICDKKNSTDSSKQESSNSKKPAVSGSKDLQSAKAMESQNNVKSENEDSDDDDFDALVAQSLTSVNKILNKRFQK